MGFFAGFSLFSLLLIEPFAVVHYAADGRVACRSDLDKVKADLACPFKGGPCINDPNLIV